CLQHRRNRSAARWGSVRGWRLADTDLESWQSFLPSHPRHSIAQTILRPTFPFFHPAAAVEPAAPAQIKASPGELQSTQTDWFVRATSWPSSEGDPQREFHHSRFG